jgi:hypothetical protein
MRDGTVRLYSQNCQDSARTLEILEARHWFDDALDGTMILFDDVVQVLDLPDLERPCRGTGRRTAGHRDHGRHPAASAQQAQGIEHISVAVAQMENITQQNAALVEEATATSGALAEVVSR